jgi:TrmH family RNA methyltransferase
LFDVPVVRVGSPAHVADWIATVRSTLGGCAVAGAEETGAVDVDRADFRMPTVAIFGNEARGLSRAYQDLASVRVRIPMAGAATSLNVSIAASVLLYEVRRQRRQSDRLSQR